MRDNDRETTRAEPLFATGASRAARRGGGGERQRARDACVARPISHLSKTATRYRVLPSPDRRSPQHHCGLNDHATHSDPPRGLPFIGRRLALAPDHTPPRRARRKTAVLGAVRRRACASATTRHHARLHLLRNRRPGRTDGRRRGRGGSKSPPTPVGAHTQLVGARPRAHARTREVHEDGVQRLDDRDEERAEADRAEVVRDRTAERLFLFLFFWCDRGVLLCLLGFFVGFFSDGARGGGGALAECRFRRERPPRFWRASGPRHPVVRVATTQARSLPDGADGAHGAPVLLRRRRAIVARRCDPSHTAPRLDDLRTHHHPRSEEATTPVVS